MFVLPQSIVFVLVSAGLAVPTAVVPDLGTLQGALDASQVVALFRGIPYGKAPVGDLRWRAPVPYGPWESPRDSSQFGNSCKQIQPHADLVDSEDCLFLNVAAPAFAVGKSTGLSVIFYIHGGGYDDGSSTFNSPETLALRSLRSSIEHSKSVVVVTSNYRLGIFGFLGSETMRSRSAMVGNFGIQDQRLALKWVGDHIGAFGGGRDITIFGESAGGNAVLNHLVQPASRGMFSRAILDSGVYDGTPTMTQAEETFTKVLAAAGCANLDCLLELSTELVLAASQAVTQANWGPAIDGVALPGFPQDLIADGSYDNEVPVLLGSNRDEMSYWMAKRPVDLSALHLPSNLTTAEADYLIGMSEGTEVTEKLLAVYAPDRYEYPDYRGEYDAQWWTVLRIFTDGGNPPSLALGHCNVRRTARLLERGGSPRVFVYLFAHPIQMPVEDMNVGKPIAASGPGNPVVQHASELPMVFAMSNSLSEEAGEVYLSQAMSGYWINFANNGDPNHPQFTEWNVYNKTTDMVMRFDVMDNGGSRMESGIRAEACSFWDSLAQSELIV